MNPQDLLDRCLEAIERWKATTTQSPATIQLTIVSDRRPTAGTVRPFGPEGPKGRIDLAKPKDGKWTIVSSFSAVAVANFVYESTGQDKRVGRTR
jgi:hypothetical protein